MKHSPQKGGGLDVWILNSSRMKRRVNDLWTSVYLQCLNVSPQSASICEAGNNWNDSTSPVVQTQLIYRHSDGTQSSCGAVSQQVRLHGKSCKYVWAQQSSDPSELQSGNKHLTSFSSDFLQGDVMMRSDHTELSVFWFWCGERVIQSTCCS